MTPMLGIMASGISGNLWSPGKDYDSIATTTVGGGGAASITFSSIPATYKHLQIRISARCAIATVLRNITLRVNSDTGANYTTHYMFGDGATVTAGAEVSVSFMYPGITAGASANADVFAANVMDILDYANTNKNKTLRNLQGIDNNGSGRAYLASGLWNSTSAITSLTFGAEGGSNFDEYSSFALYGVK
jgi:hypothetical protein